MKKSSKKPNDFCSDFKKPIDYFGILYYNYNTPSGEKWSVCGEMCWKMIPMLIKLPEIKETVKKETRKSSRK
jgi:hypothetical protein